MAQAPIYVSRLAGEEAPQLRAPRNDAGTTIGNALAGTGQALGQLGAAVAAAGEDTRAAEATTNYLTRLNDLQTKYERDPDFQNAGRNFAAERASLQDDVLGQAGLGQARQADLGVSFTRLGLSAQNGVDQTSLTRNVSATNAALDRQENLFYSRVRAAKSAPERAAIIGEWDRAVDAPVQSGLIGADQAQGRKDRRDAAIDEGDALELVRNDPTQAAAALADANRFRSLGPGKREQLIASAGTAADAVAVDDLVSRARWKPETASLELGRVQDPSHLAGIFDQGVIPAESGGRNSVPGANGQQPYALTSPKGAIGVAQLMPGTARDMAAKLGLKDVAGLDDAGMKARLLADPVLGRKLGMEYFGEQAARYDGSVPLALAAYNAGPKEADRWKAAAEAKFGPNPSPAQILSVVDFKETRDYVANIYGRLGARMDVRLSPTAAFRAANGIGEVLDADARARNSAIKDLAAVDRNENDPTDSLKEGFAVDPGGLANYKRTQAAAAAIGDREAATELRRVNEAEAAAPFIREAYGMAPADLGRAIGGMRASLANSPDVSGEQARRLKAFEAAADTITKERDKNPVGLGERAQLFQPIEKAGLAIDPGADLGNQRDALAWRGRQAEAAAANYGGKALPFKPQEAAALAERWRNADDGQRAGMLGAMAGAMPAEAYRQGVAQITGSDGLGFVAGMVARDRPEVAKTILRGAEFLKGQGVGKAGGIDVNTLKSAAATALGGGNLFADPASQGRILDAAVAYYAGSRGAAGGLYDNPSRGDFEDAIEAVAGVKQSRGGRDYLAPPGMPASEAEHALDNLDEATVKALGGARGAGGKPFTPDDLARHAVLVKGPDEFGSRYALGVRDDAAPDGYRPIFTDAGTPLVVDLRDLAAGRPAREKAAPTPKRLPWQGGLGLFN